MALRSSFSVTILLSVVVFAALSTFSVHAQSPSSSPSAAPSPTSDGTSIDQGIAYVLMLTALVLTYLIHPLDASSFGFF
ncbi:Arabinogalactan protein 20 [Linum grandiflorum]